MLPLNNYDDTAAKARAQYMRGIASSKAAAGVFVLGLVVCVVVFADGAPDPGGLLSLAAPRGRGRSLHEEIRDIKQHTESLALRVGMLGDSLSAMARDLNRMTDEREARVNRVGELVEAARLEATSLRAHVKTRVEALKEEQETTLATLQKAVDTMQTKCTADTNRRPPAADDARAAAAGAGRADSAYQYDPGSAYFSNGVPPSTPVSDPCSEHEAGDESLNACRRDAVRTAFQHSWKGYKEYAWGSDELQPVSRKPKNWGPGGGLGLTMVDAISTMWVMGLKDEFHEVREWIKTGLDLDQNYGISAFEATIRLVGAMVSAYELSGERHPEFLDVAENVAQRILWAYNTSSGIPHATVNLFTHQHSSPQWTGGSSVLSEFGTVQLELRTLSYHT
eukprot:gene8456-13039_t